MFWIALHRDNALSVNGDANPAQCYAESTEGRRLDCHFTQYCSSTNLEFMS